MKILLALAILLFSLSTVAKPPNACDFPVPKYKIGEASPSGIQQQIFNQILSRTKQVYAPIFAARNCPFVLHSLWSDGTVNAVAYRDGGKCHVEMYGGLARYPGMTEMGFQIVLCHEIGHHLGGQPTYNQGRDWASVEGQSDYWATLSCMKTLGLDSMAGSLVTASVLARLSGDRTPSRSTRDTSKVRTTYEGHPRAQCRLDTMDWGREAKPRPGCWFAGGGCYAGG